MSVYRNLLRYVSDIKKEIGLKSFLGVMISLTYILQAILMVQVVEMVRTGDAAGRILRYIAAVLFWILIRGLLTREFEAYGKVLASRIKGKLRIAILDQVFLLGPGYLNARRSGKVTSLIVDGIESLEAFFVSFLPQVATVLISGGAIFIFLFRFDKVGAVLLLGSMILCVVVPFVTVPLISRTVTDYWSGYSVLTAQYIDAVQGMTTLKTLNAERIKGEELGRDAKEFYKKSIRNTGISLVNSAIMLVLSAVTSSITVVIVAIRSDAGLAPTAAVTAFLFLAVECARPMMDLNRYWHSSFLGLSVARELFDFVKEKPGVQEAAAPDTSSMEKGLPDIRLEKVSFSYSAGAQAVKQVTMEFPAGSTTAIVGHSGSGKSTLLNLLLRFYDAQEGQILINGVDIRNYGIEYLQGKIAVVFQDSFLFYGTVAENIRMARPDASEEEVIQAAKAANAHEFILGLPGGYETIVGERGANLSGGERQRIAIARAILKDAPILLLDEATSSVDAKSEAMIQKALSGLMKNRTTIVVAHRLSTIQNADKIFVLEEGALAEMGTHRELLAKDGVYLALIKAQEVIAQ